MSGEFAHEKASIKTYEVVVLAAHRLLAAGVASNAEDIDRVAIETNRNVQTLEVDREQAQKARGENAGEVDGVRLHIDVSANERA